MSAEDSVNSSTSEAVGDKEAKRSVSETKETEKTKPDCPDTDPSVDGIATDSILSQRSSISNTTKTWLASLSSEELSSVFSFEDGPFLATFLQYAAPWSSATHAKEKPVFQIDWCKLVSLEEFEKMHTASDFEETTPKFSNKKYAPAKDPIGDNTVNTPDAEDTAFRIGQSSSATAIFDNDPSCEFAKKMFPHVVCICPSAYKHVSEYDTMHPHLILRPEYFEQMGPTFSEACTQSKFLLFESYDAEGTSPLAWLRQLRETEETSVPLYRLLLARLEWAAWQEFCRYGHGKETNAPSTDGPIVHTKSKSLFEVFAYCREVRDIAISIDSATTEKFWTPLAETLTFAIVGGVDNVILTPFLWILYTFARTGPSTFDLLDDAVDASLNGMKEHKSIGLLKSAGRQPLESTNGTNAGKKKKKIKKRKSKKVHIGGSAFAARKLVSSDEGLAVEQSKVDGRNDLEGDSNIGSHDEEITSRAKDNGLQESAEVNSVGSQPGDESSARNDVTDEDNAEVILIKKDHKASIPIAECVTLLPVSADVVPVIGSDTNNGDDDEWETVEVRNKGSRRRSHDRAASANTKQSHYNFPGSTSHDNYGMNGKKSKGIRTAATRKKHACRKMVREILFSIIDSMDDEPVQSKIKGIASPTRSSNSWTKGPPGCKLYAQTSSVPLTYEGVASGYPDGKKSSKPATDVVASIMKRDIRQGSTTADYLHTKDDLPSRFKSTENSDVAQKDLPGNAGKKSNGISVAVADQSTAPTYQETVSSVSASFNNTIPKDRIGSSGSRRVESYEAGSQEPRRMNEPKGKKKVEQASPTPPLPTLLSPEIVNSASSSVASSLDAPHAGRLHRHTVQVPDVNDVGFHLLDVCERLSRDMSLFMSRRALALSARRRERGALVAALQNSVSTIWPGRCHVELYGSCATQLDLPSSDIDVVILGLGNPGTVPSSQQHQTNHLASESPDGVTTKASFGNGSGLDDGAKACVVQSVPISPYGRQANTERVKRLGTDLEAQPWAVQVNAIPTASVPVIKVLADPSRLAVASAGGDWMIQHQHIAEKAAAAGKSQNTDQDVEEEQPMMKQSYPQPTLLPWRGSDVMKGLLSIDITFEGPEHGGIGSTEFSSHVVSEACSEAGLHPDATPLVQVVMVLKELLAQRKLNEPYSGGLSSYALLLLVVALIRERSVIREEIERIEQQRQAMAAAEMNSYTSDYARATHQQQTRSPWQQSVMDTNPREQRNASNEGKSAARNFHFSQSRNMVPKPQPQIGTRYPRAEPTTQVQQSPSAFSWASIAKKSAAPVLTSATTQTEAMGPQDDVAEKLEKKPTFADAAKRSTVTSADHAKPISGTEDDTKSRNAAAITTKASPGTDASVENPVSVSTPKEQAQVRSSSSPFYPQGYNDIVEVLCSGETTAGKLLMHFLLYYGQHFDAQNTAIDISGKHERNFGGMHPPYSYYSPYIQRQAPGTIDPITGMLTVDPIVIYDPLEGAENNNVARRCFAWNSVRWIFAQSYTTLASAVERSASPPSTPGGSPSPVPANTEGRDREPNASVYNPDAIGDLMDPSSPLLRCLLSF